MIEKLRRSHGRFPSGTTNLVARAKHLLRKLGVLVPIVVLVTACGGAAQATATPSGLSTNYVGALSVENQLVAGSVLLEDTELAIDKDQADSLLPLWQAFRSLSNSDTAAQAEIDALVTQIEEAMSAEQIQAIERMQLTSDDLASVLQQHAAESMASAGGTTDTGPSAAFGPNDGGGFIVGSGPGPGGDDGMAFLAPSGGQGTILSAASTDVPSQNLTTASRSDDRAALRLVDSLITLLETKANA
jgi:hypothetical protein